MPRIRKFSNVKFGTSGGPYTVGPQGLAAAATIVTQPIPARGARAVLFVVTGTDANVPQTPSFNVTSNMDGAAANFQSGTGATYNALRTINNMPVNTPGGLHMMVTHPDGVLPQAGVSLVFQAHATNPHTGLSIDAYVFYDWDLSEVLPHMAQQAFTNSLGQPSATVYPS